VGNVSATVCVKSRCAPLRIKKALGIFRKLIPRTRRRTTSGSKTSFSARRIRPAKAVITIAIRLWYDYDTTMPRRIRLRRKWSKLRFDCDTTTTRLRRKHWRVNFFARVVRVVANHNHMAVGGAPHCRNCASWRNNLRHNKHGFYER